MQLMTKELAAKIPKLYETDDIPPDEKTIYVKYFLPGLRWTWYAAEYGPDEEVCFGYVLSGIDPNFDEWGYFSLSELKENDAERDLYFKPVKFSEVKK